MHVFSVCILVICVCGMSAHEKGSHNLHTKCISASSVFRVGVFTSPSGLLRVTFPIILSHFSFSFSNSQWCQIVIKGTRIGFLLWMEWEGGAK